MWIDTQFTRVSRIELECERELLLKIDNQYCLNVVYH